ncbi:MAG: HNH endonuclease [Pirellulales bacterium]
MNEQLRGQVRQRAHDRCEYCGMPQHALPYLVLHVDHIIAKQHVDEASDDLESLAWACSECNSFKGTDIAAHPPGSDEIVPLFNPRTVAWKDHFFWEGAVLRGKTPIGFATIELLRTNQRERVDHRQLLMQLGLWT